MSSIANRVSDSFLRISDKLIKNAALPNIPNWISEKTFLKGKPWSFKGHEFQIAIASDTSPRLVVKKCSQVGLSELQVRFILAFLCIKTGLTAIYVLPTRVFAMKFSKGRIDPVILGSPEISRRLVRGVDGAELKQIGESFLYVGGANSDSQAISIPADLLVRDEYDFGDETILGKYNSRLRHAENGGLARDFSTPTVSGYGIDAAYTLSTQGIRLCKCKHCGTWQEPDFHEVIRIPGFTGQFKDFSALDLPNYDIGSAYFSCIKCGKDLFESLSDPETREWVHKFPARTVSGYQVTPLDVPSFNTPTALLSQLSDYPLRADYENFVLGRTHSDNTSEVNLSAVKETTFSIQPSEAEGCSIGIDVGHVLYVTIGKNVQGKDNFIARFTIDSRNSDPIEEIGKLVKRYKAINICIDANPDLSLVRQLVQKYEGIIPVYPCSYVEDSGKDIQVVNVNNNGVASIKRTRAFDELVGRINNKLCVFTEGSETATVLQHFHGMKRVRKKDDKGEEVARWVKVSNFDHFFHSTLYCSIAIYLSGQIQKEEVQDIPLILPALASLSSGVLRSNENAFNAKELVSFYGVQ